MEYSHFTAEEFASDPDFISWIKSPSEELSHFWSAWISSHPEKRADIDRARQIVLALEIKEIAPPEGDFLKVWANINTAIRSAERVHMKPSASNRSSGAWKIFHRNYRVAAALLIAALAGLYFWRGSDREVLIATGYGESRTLCLPDSTKITLNANSSIRYRNLPFAEFTREVWLEGEAFFTVSSTVDRDQFIVHTNDLQIQVLGTRFNVNCRRGNTKVVLDEGKVKLDLKGRDEPLIMKKGELVTFSEKEGIIEKRSVDPSSYTSWRNNRLTFNSTTLEEIAALLEDTYGFKVFLKGEHLKHKAFTGSSSAEDVQELLGKLRDVFNLEIIKRNNQIIIQEKY